MSVVANKSPSIIIPINFYTLECGKCESTNWQVKILPQDGQPVIQAIRCSCGNTFRIDNQRKLDGSGLINFDKLLKPGVKPNG